MREGKITPLGEGKGPAGLGLAPGERKKRGRTRKVGGKLEKPRGKPEGKRPFTRGDLLEGGSHQEKQKKLLSCGRGMTTFGG